MRNRKSFRHKLARFDPFGGYVIEDRSGEFEWVILARNSIIDKDAPLPGDNGALVSRFPTAYEAAFDSPTNPRSSARRRSISASFCSTRSNRGPCDLMP